MGGQKKPGPPVWYCYIGAHGPDLPFAPWLSAAEQLHQTGHSSILQNFRRVKVC